MQGGNCQTPNGSLVPTLPKLTKTERLLRRKFLHMALKTEGKLRFLAKAFHLSRDKNDYFCRLQIYPFSSSCS
jgi:hypothetical protein